MQKFIFLATISFVFIQTSQATTYLQDVKPILDNNCIECHDGVGHDPDLRSFPFSSQKLPSQEAIVDKILEKVVASPLLIMPPGNRPKLNSSEIATIQQWRNGGLQED